MRVSARTPSPLVGLTAVRQMLASLGASVEIGAGVEASLPQAKLAIA
jgi:hypothetical protein